MIMDELITDRKELDRARVKELAAIGWTHMTAAQRAEWETFLKGSYTDADMNRVGEAVVFLTDYLNGLQGVLDAYRAARGVAPDSIFNVTWGAISVSVKVDWTDADEPTPAQLTAYLSAVNTVTAAITVTRALPGSMIDLTITGANEIEKALQAEYDAGLDFEALKKTLIENAAAAWFYSGDLYGGEV